MKERWINAYDRFRDALSGPNTVGQSQRFWNATLGVIGLGLIYPLFAGAYGISITTGYFIWTILAMSLALVWGYAGILSLGHIAFFGLGGYTFGVVGINLLPITGGTQLALIAGTLIPALVAVGLGYFMFYGRVGGIFVSIITLAVTLLLEVVLSRTAGPQYTIGDAALGGYGGMANIPSVTFGIGANTDPLGPISFYYFVVLSTVVVYFGLRYLLNSSFGYRIIAIRENERRTELFGYDIRKEKLIAFGIGAGLAGFGGSLYAAWGNFISPPIFGLLAAILPIIWVMFGGYESITGGVIGALTLQWLENELSGLATGLSDLFLGVLFILVILYLPGGLTPNLPDLYGRVEGAIDRIRERFGSQGDG